MKKILITLSDYHKQQIDIFRKKTAMDTSHILRIAIDEFIEKHIKEIKE